MSARVLFLGEPEGRLRLPHLLLRLFNAGILRIDLSDEVRDGGLGLGDLCPCLSERRLIVARIDPHQHSIRIHYLIVSYRKVDDRSSNLRADRDRPRIDECVISGFILEHV